MSEIRILENAWITLKDGCRLAARIWLPDDAERHPVPAILEYIPYRKRDGTFQRDEITHSQLSARGYACVRVDIRGSGESDGLMENEYTAQELADGVEIIGWLAAQTWCDGKVGMMGISWGGFNALQVAALRPPALKAIVTVCSSDKRYECDIHYAGGCLLNDNLQWSAQMTANWSRPPDPAIVGNRWRDMWRERIEAMPFLAANWLQHQHRDSFWRHGSVGEQINNIQAAVFAVGGWGDPYSETVPRLLARLKAPALGLVGPWLHKYPHLASPEPCIDFVNEITRWWDFHLKDKRTRIMSEPRYRAYMLESLSPAADYPFRPGRWIAETQWPSGDIGKQTFYLNRGGLEKRSRQKEKLSLFSPLTVGSECGSFCPGMLSTPEYPGDQRPDDAFSLVFDTEPLNEKMEILGAPVLKITVSSDRPVAQLVARLCDVHPDGASVRVTYAVINLCHRGGHEIPRPLMPGEFYNVRLQMRDIAYAFPAEHRIRIALSTAYWPMIWPPPEPARLEIVTTDSYLTLPSRPLREEAAVEFAFPPPPPPPSYDVIRQGRGKKAVIRDIGTGVVTIHTESESDSFRIREHGLEGDGRALQRYTISPNDPLSAQAAGSWKMECRRGDWHTSTETTHRMRCDREHFYLEGSVIAYEGKTVFARQKWQEKIPRDLV